MKKVQNGKSLKKTLLISQRNSEFNKAIKGFNNRLKNALKNEEINEKSYKTLLIGKEKKDFYRENIMTDSQFDRFVKELEFGNAQTFKKLSKGRLADLDITRYEQKLFNKNSKLASKIDDVYDIHYSDVVVNVREDNFEKVYNRLLKSKLTLENRPVRYRENFIKAYKRRFGTSNDMINKLSINDIEELLRKNPRFSIQLVYDEQQEAKTVKEAVDEAIEKQANKKNKRKTKK